MLIFAVGCICWLLFKYNQLDKMHKRAHANWEMDEQFYRDYIDELHADMEACNNVSYHHHLKDNVD